MSQPKTILVTGATGKQGGAIISALLAAKAPFKIVGVTRNLQSSRAVALAAKPNVTMISGGYEDPVALSALQVMSGVPSL